MSGRTVNSAILLLILGNALAIGSDVVIKLLSTEAPVFQFVFMRSVCIVLLLLPLWRQVDFLALFAGGKLHLLRAHISLLGVVFMVVALGNLPLATANALFYAAPLLVVLLSVVLFRERMTLLSLAAVISGFVGILVILRPVEIGWAALSALAAAAALAINAVLVRKLPLRQSMVHALLLNSVLVLPAAGGMALFEKAEWDWSLMLYAGGSSSLILGYNMAVLLAYRHVAANQVTSAEYTGLLWAVAIGWLWFGEVPDFWLLAGALLVVVPLILLGVRHRRTAGRSVAAAGG